MKTILSFIAVSFLFQPNFTAAQTVKIQYLANEGVLIKSANTEILIDAAFTKEFDYLDVLPNAELEKITKAKNPYESVDILLATHVHGDHFNAQVTGNHMITNTRTMFLGTEETVANFRESFKDYGQITSRVMPLTPALLESKTVTLKNTTIQVLRFEHLGTTPWKEAENVAFLISIGGKKILHLGDSKMDIESLEKFNLKNEQIDVAILPYWQLGPREQKEIIEQYIQPKQILAAHIPLNNSAKAQESIDSLGYKNVTCLIEQFKTITLGLED